MTDTAANPSAAGRRPPAANAPLRAQGGDREFLPAALEILTTPPSPVAMAMLVSICALVVAALLWSYLGWIDIYAVAPGKVQLSGRSKVVQPLEAGKVIAIHVRNGSRVQAGEVLLELDPTTSTADVAAQQRDLQSLKAEEARRRSEIGAVRGDSDQAGAPVFPAELSEAVVAREKQLFNAELAQFRAARASLHGQLAEKVAARDKLTAVIEARQKLLALAKERVDMRRELEPKGSGSRALTIDALQQYERLVTEDTTDRGQLIETEASIEALKHKADEAVAQFIADQSQKLVEAERKRDRLEQELIKSQWHANRTELRAPVAGTVQQLSVSTVGQVVSSGQSVLTVVPFDGPIEVDAMVANRDIGFIRVGQPVVVKIDAFPFTRYGTIDGDVAELSRDAIDERSAAELNDGVRPAAQPPATSANQVQSLVFPAVIALHRQSIAVDGKDVPLTPGMSVSVEIKTGERRIIDYVLSPLRDIGSRAARER